MSSGYLCLVHTPTIRVIAKYGGIGLEYGTVWCWHRYAYYMSVTFTLLYRSNGCLSTI